MFFSASVGKKALQSVSLRLILVGITLVLMLVSRTSFSQSFKGMIVDILAPPASLLTAAARWPLLFKEKAASYFFVYEQNQELNKKLSEFGRLAAENEVAKLQIAQAYSILKWKARGGEDFYRTVSAVLSNKGPFSQNIVLDSGKGDGLRVGDVLQSTRNLGLVGRVIRVGLFSSLVLPLTEINMRIPVIVGSQQIFSIVSGTNKLSLTLKYTHQRENIRLGDMVVTSGAAGFFPPYLPVGRVSSITQRSINVEPFYQAGETNIFFIRHNLRRDLEEQINSENMPRNDEIIKTLQNVIEDQRPLAVPSKEKHPSGKKTEASGF